MVVENNEKDPASYEQAREKVSTQVREAADAIKELIQSVSIGVEEKIAMQGKIDRISNEIESMLDIIDGIARKNQKEILIEYRNFLQRNLEAVDQRLKELE
ncbi:MAG TPA: DUF5320 domain-containing protein [Nitrososphaera sp.]|jgi:hypothetical protein